MKKRFLRAVAGVMTLLLLTTGLSGATAVYAGEDTAAATKQEKVLTVTQDMVGKNGILTITGEWDRIVIPKEIDASRIKFKKVKTGSVEIESGNKSKIEVDSGEYGEIAVVPAKVEEMSVEELLELMRLTGDPHTAIEQYQKQREQNDAYLDARPTVVTGKDAEVGTVMLSGNVKLDCKNGTVANLKVEADGSQKELNVNVSNYEGNVSVKQTEREDGDWMIARVKMNNSKVESLDMEGAGRGNIVLSGQNTEVKDVNVASAPTVSLNLPSQNVNVKETAKSAVLNILAKIESILIHANDVKMDVGSCGSIADAKIEGDNIFVTGNGTLLKVDITGDGAYVSTVGTDVTGKNNYVPPAPVGGIRDLGGLHVVIGDWYSTTPEVAVTEEQIAQEKYRKEMMEKYNFTVEQKYISDWDHYQDVFRTSVALGTPAANIFLMDQRFLEGNRDYFYDLSTLYEFDFDAEKWDEDVKELMTWKDGIYGMSAADKEARGGVFINMDLYEQAIENAELSMDDYDPFVLQAKGEWTWSKFEEICGILVDNLNAENVSEADKIYALSSQNVMTLNELICSTGSDIVSYDPVKGEYVNNLTDPNVKKAYEFATGLIEKGYDLYGEDWHLFAKAFYNEKAVMQFGETYYMNVGTSADYVTIYKYNDMVEKGTNIAFLCCPKPDEGSGSDSYHTYFTDNVAVMPACYDAQTAADIAFVYNIWTNPAPGYESEVENEWKDDYVNHKWDERSTNETLDIIYNKAVAVPQYVNFLEDLEQYTMENEYFEIDGTLYYNWQFHTKWLEEEEREQYDWAYFYDSIDEYWDTTIAAANVKRQLYMPTARPDASFSYEASPYMVDVNPDGTIRLKKHKDPDSQGSDIVIPSELFGRKVVEIAPNAFRGRDITSVVIPEGVTKISPYAFGEDYALVTVTTPNSLTTIGDNAFFKCVSLQDMNLTKNVTSIGELAFSECWTANESNLTITTTEGSYADNFAQKHNIPVQYEGQVSTFTYEYVDDDDKVVGIWITGYETLADKVVIPEMISGTTVVAVSGGAFEGCTNITDITIPENVKFIGEHAFAGCTGLTEVYVPESVVSIHTSAFADCGEQLVIKTKSEYVIEAAKLAGIKYVDLREQQ